MGAGVAIEDAGSWRRKVLGRSDGGKMTDSQDSFVFFFRRVDPRRENFSLSATFEVEDVSGVDFQTAWGIAAVDTVESPADACRHRNFALAGRFRTPDGRNYGHGLRIVGGYTSPHARPRRGRRILDPSRQFDAPDDGTRIIAGCSQRFRLAKTDEGLEASLLTGNDWQTVKFPGCDFLLKQDRRYIYVGFAVAGKIGLKIYNIEYQTFPGILSHTPEGAAVHCVPDYPFARTAFAEPGQTCGSRERDMTFRVSPLDGLGAVLHRAGPGCEIILSDGVYDDGPYYIPEASSGEPGRPVRLRAEHPGKAVLSGASFARKLPAMTLRASCWELDGLVFSDAPSSGLFICGSSNTVTRCEACRNGDTGILICAFPGSGKDGWPSLNRVERCLSQDNRDEVRRNADGFGAKLSVGPGNGFFSCISSGNADDGFDLYTKGTLGPVAPVTLEGCEASCNAVGFKLGGEGQRVRHRLKGCVAHGNSRAGFDANSNPSSVLRGCRAWENAPDYKGLPFMSSLINRLCSR